MTLIPSGSYRAALYMRLSKEDGNCESTSITNQRKLLSRYASDHHFTVTAEFCDDGWSGTSFDRPAFKQMIAAIEAGEINLVLVKDLSRLGRDYIATGQYTELYFPSRQVRCIAVNDGYDSLSCDTDLIPFKNVMNEMYARDISRKIRSSLKSRMEEGAFIGNFPPYGYQRSETDRHSLVPDMAAAPVVKEIFYLAFLGSTTGEIAKELNRRNIPCPSLHRYLKSSSHSPADSLPPKTWTGNTVLKMLHNPVYLGHMAQGKTRKLSFKSTQNLPLPSSQWTTVPHTHEPLVKETVFLSVQSGLDARRHKKSSGFSNLFTGIAFCSGCGHGMSTYGGHSPCRRLVCGSYKSKGNAACSSHFIPYDDLCAIVLFEITKQLELLSKYKKYLCDKLREQCPNNSLPLTHPYPAPQFNQEHILSLLYQDRLAGRITADEYDGYVKKIHIFIEASQEKNAAPAPSAPAFSAEQIIENLVEKWLHPQELTALLLTHYVKKIEISQRDGTQKIRIFITPDDHPWQWALDAMLPELWDAVSSTPQESV